MTTIIIIGIFIAGTIAAWLICRGGKCDSDEHESGYTDKDSA